MNINPVFNNYARNTYNCNLKSQKETSKEEVSFYGHGKPITLKYVVEKRSHLVPEKVLTEAKRLLASGREDLPSLYDLHKSLYKGLLDCKTLDEVKAMYPEFEQMNDNETFVRQSVNTKKCPMMKDKNFGVKLLQELWANLKNKEDLAYELGLGSRSSLGYLLEQINFVSYDKNYKTLLKASNEEMQAEIAGRTRAWNQLHPDLMYARNKHAAQFCKTDEFKEAQSRRMKEYDIEHPERREKIGAYMKEVWALCPDVRKTFSIYYKQSNELTQFALRKKISGEKLTEKETRMIKTFYKTFWDQNPELLAAYENAFATVSARIKKQKKKIS